MDFTNNTPFFSKSGQSGVTRWAMAGLSHVPLATDYLRGYVLHAPVYNRQTQWFLCLLRGSCDTGFTIEAFGVPSPEEGLPLDADLLLLHPGLVLEAKAEFTDRGVDSAIKRYERVVSNVMHGKLSPQPETQPMWAAIAAMEA